MPKAYLSLGANLGDRSTNIKNALDLLHNAQCCVKRVSRLYETIHVGGDADGVPPYLNCAAMIETNLTPIALLDEIQIIERQIGRTPCYRWGPRIIDIDILSYGSVSLKTDRLILPHERMMERAFVLVPLAEVEPDYILPDGNTINMKLALPEIAAQVVQMWER